MVTDHIDGNGLNNSKKNLRNATYGQNAQNKKQNENEKISCKYIGVVFDKRAKKYAPRISGKHLGYFDDEDEAAKVYDIHAFLNYGEYAKTNGMIKFEEIKNLELSKKSERILPKNISLRKDNKYYAEINYKNKKYRSLYYADINQAIDSLNEFKRVIQDLKNDELLLLNKREIVRNGENLAVIQIFDKNNNVTHNIIVDDNNWHSLSLYKWYINGHGYAKGNINGKVYSMHAYIMKFDAKDDILIDHINRNKLDNRVSNLRKSNHQINNHNKSMENSTSIYKGVSLNKGKWRAAISYNYENNLIGYFDNEIHAAIAYNKEAKKLYRENASINDSITLSEYEEYDELYKDKSLKKIQYSKYRGVTKSKDNRWGVNIFKDKKSIYIGIYSDEIEAALAYNDAALKAHGKEYKRLNIIEPELLNEFKLRHEKKNILNPNNKKNTTSSKYYGVFFTKNSWHAAIQRNNKKKIYLGRFDTELNAAKAYNDKAIEIDGKNTKLNVLVD